MEDTVNDKSPNTSRELLDIKGSNAESKSFSCKQIITNILDISILQNVNR